MLLLSAVLFSACRKHSNSSTGVPTDAEYFIFGENNGFCPTPCSQYYQIMSNQLYKSYFDSTGALQYSGTPMASDKYNIALPAFTDFPSYFSLHPNKDIRCQTCADMSSIHLEYKRGGSVYQWNIDYPYEGIPTEIRAYVDEVHNIMNNLN